tara:strand:+ start:330 stop:1673 length:1344 start_codon:yes stop_codon:yes gene_type:complete
MKKFFTYQVFLVIFIFTIASILYGFSIKYYTEGGKKFPYLKGVVLFIAEIPRPLIHMFKSKSFNPNKPKLLKKHKDKVRFKQFIENKRNALLVLPTYNNDLGVSKIDIIDLVNFKIIHTYRHDVDEMNNQVKNIEKFPRIKIDKSKTRFEYRHPLLLEDGSIISDSDYSVEFKIDFCSNLKWINDEIIFHHSKMLDHEGNVWVAGQIDPKSKYVKKFSINRFGDDAIIKINTDGKILYKKSVLEILIDNNILPENFALNSSLSGEFDPIHLNDIEPALYDTDYWNQGDVFLSPRNQSAIIHFRPSTNKVINYITGPFAEQHDVDIISETEISIFNNNSFLVNNELSEILIYNFETKEFKKLFNEQLKIENFKTESQGLSHIFKDGSLMVEEQNHGRIILFNMHGEKEWEFINKDKKGIGFISWSRIIEDELFIEKFKSLVKNQKCLN